MGRELQKKKRRSGLTKAVRKPKSKKQILNNPIIAASWDSKQTLSQNYARLGLTTRLNKQTGGQEKFNLSPVILSRPVNRSLTVHPLHSAGSSEPQPRGVEARHDGNGTKGGKVEAQNMGLIPEIRVERDPGTGAILRIVETTADQPSTQSLQRPMTAAEAANRKSARKHMNSMVKEGVGEDAFDSEEEQRFPAGFQDSHAPEGFIGAAALDENSNPVIRELAEAAIVSGSQPKVKRKPSERERGWCARIIAKHGGDYRAMFHDRKMNVLQLSEGQIRKKIRGFQGEQ